MSGPEARSSSLFDAAAAEYDAARPSYPDELYAELEARVGPLAGRLVLDCGAGTGIASRQLAARGARVVSLDLGEQMLRRALARSPGSACVQADGNRLPVRPDRADLVSFAQSWHWLDQEHAPAEMARVLRPGGLIVGSDGLDTPDRRRVHHDDIFVPVDPDALPGRLRAAGFAETQVQVRGDRLRFTAKVPGSP